ncbi:MAG: energy-coupling factor transporter ATPase [Clostridia bacterium]|nr:energy-coupling factor transporter ATPase [Clostridia bacterium]
MGGSMISVKNVSFSYDSEEKEDRKKVLDNVSLDINQGELVAVLGHNGSGKSTLVKTFNGICIPDEGCVTVDGLDTGNEENCGQIRRKVGMVFQNPDNQIVATIVEEDVAFGPENLGIESEQIRKRVDDALRTVGMTAYASHAPHMLSGGQKQRVAIAGVIAMEPSYIVFDESTAMLDPKGRKEVIETIKKLNSKGITIILITHYMEEAALCDRIIVMNKGRVEKDGTPTEIFADAETMQKLGLGVPQPSLLAYELGKQGVKFEKTPLTAEEFIKEFTGKIR